MMTYYDSRIRKIMCPYCHVPMRPFGGRLTPGFSDMPEVFLCVHCHYQRDLRLAVAEALNDMAAIRRRAMIARGYLVEQGYIQLPTENGNGKKRRIRRWIAKRLVKLIDGNLEITG